MNRDFDRGGGPIGIANQLRYDEVTGCWNFTGHIMPNGYGSAHWRGRKIGVHVLAAIIWLRFDPRTGLCVCHRCDNRRCFNPKNLFIGTRFDNMRDAVAKGRFPLHTHCKNGHESTLANRNKAGACVICARAYRQQWRHRLALTCQSCGIRFAGTEGKEVCSRKCGALLRWKRYRESAK